MKHGLEQPLCADMSQHPEKHVLHLRFQLHALVALIPGIQPIFLGGKCSISWNRTEEHFVPHRSSSFMLTAHSSREARVRRSAARNWLLLCESEGCNIIKPQECIEQPVAPSAKEVSLKLLSFFGFEEILTTPDCAFVYSKSCFSFFPSSLSFFPASLSQDIQ